MQNNLFPDLHLNDWKETRDTLHKYSQMVGAIRETMSDPHPHWWHISLLVSKCGLTTTSIRKTRDPADDQSFEVSLDLEKHKLKVESSFREEMQIALTGQSLSALCDETCALLTDIGVHTPIERPSFIDGSPRKYNQEKARNYWNALEEINRIMNKFRAELSGERSPVQLWSHHFDLSMSWYSGRLIPDKDPDDAESSQEQMMFGFSTGDDGIPDAYFYIIPYPTPESFPNFDMPEGARWNAEGFSGGVLMYETLLKSDNPEELLLNYFRTFQKAGAELMK
jgi:hypothetical protein